MQVRRQVLGEVVASEVEEPATASLATAGFAEVQLPALFELLSRVARAVVASTGPDTEVVVHDLRDPEHSVVAISGALTGRQVGAPVPDPQLLPGEVDKFTEDDIRRRAITSAGRELVASTAWVRDAAGHIVGALCVNVDQSGVRQARDLIDRHLGSTEDSKRPLPTFASNLTDFARLAIEAVLGPGPRRPMRRAERLELIRRLDSDGVFAVRHATDAVAAELAVSRSSIYGDLRGVRSSQDSSARDLAVDRAGEAAGHPIPPHRPRIHRLKTAKRRAGQVSV